MAITYPRAMPDECLATDTMRLVRTEAAATLVSGAVQTVQLGQPRWKCDFVTKPYRMGDQRRAWRAWIDSLNGALHTFLGYSPMQKWPGRYPRGFAGLIRAAGGAFDGTGAITAISGNSLTFNGLPAGFVLKAGDLVGLVNAVPQYGLYRILQDATSSGAGAVTVLTNVAINTSLFAAGNTVNFAKPVCEMLLDPGTPPDTSTELAAKSITFTGIERLY